MDNSLYLSLCSTDSLHIFSNNVCDDFTNVLAQKLSFSVPYELALIEMHYTNAINTITKNCSLALFDFTYAWEEEETTDGQTDQKRAQSVEYGRLYDLKLPDGYYATADILCKKLNDLVSSCKIARLKDVQIFSYDNIKRKFSINVKDLWLCCIVKSGLIDVLGLERRHYTLGQAAFIGLAKDLHFYMFHGKKRYFRNQTVEWTSDSIDGGVCPYVANLNVRNTMLVYCDVLKDSIFGSQFTNLLRTIPFSGQENERIVQSFQNPIYLPLKSDVMSSINIKIRDFNSQKIDFLTDNIYLLLHLRPQK